MPPRLKQVLKLLLVVGLLVAFLVYIPIGDIYRAIRSANPLYFLIAVLLSFLSAFLGTLSTWILARRQGIAISLWGFYVFNLSIRFYGFFSPASIVSTGMRWQRLSEGNKGAEALSAIMFTRAISIFAAISMGLFWAISDINRALVDPAIFSLFFILMTAVGWVMLKLSPVFAGRLHDLSSRAHARWVQSAANFLGRFFTSLQTYAKYPASLLILVVMINLGNEFFGLIAHILIARALYISISITDMGWLRAIAFLSALAPFTLAGGFGMREVTVAIAMTAFNVSPQLAAAYSFLLYARSVLFSLLCGILELFSTLKRS